MYNKYTTYFKINKDTWDKKVSIHTKSEFYDVEGFKKGKTSLNYYELQELGNVKGKSLLHLQCHFGQDTLSWSRLGATCTGIDLSSEGIKQAKLLNSALGLNATFIESNLYDVPKKVIGEFDIVFASYGVIGWLHDLKTWGEIIASKLKIGGVFYLIEFHPIVWMYDYLDKTPVMRYAYSREEVIYEEEQGTYADETADLLSKTYSWNHGLGEVINALTEAGLHIDYLNEYDESPYNVLPDLVETKSGNYELKEKLYPLVFEIKATKL